VPIWISQKKAQEFQKIRDGGEKYFVDMLAIWTDVGNVEIRELAQIFVAIDLD
jgi:hypothetical protein